MRYFLVLLFLSVSPFAEAATYYISTLLGNDNGTYLDAQNPLTPWKTINKLNECSFLDPGDSILFRRGEVFYGSLIPNKSGIHGKVIYFGGYGIGANPVITGFTTLSNWYSLGKGLYESTLTNSNFSLNLVVFDGDLQPMGRWPKLKSQNKGYLVLKSHSSNSSITSDQLDSGLNFVGGEIVIRKVNWALDRARVVGQTQTNVYYNQDIGSQAYNAFGASKYAPHDGYGFFFQNHVNACTELGEWAYDSTKSKLRMFFGSALPNSHVVRIPTIDYLVNVKGISYIKFKDISFIGANGAIVEIENSHDIQFDGCTMDFSGVTAIRVKNSNSHTFLFNECLFSNCNNNCFTCGSSTGWRIIKCFILNIGTIRGMGLSGAGNYEGISYLGGKSLIKNTVIKNIGYNAIDFRGDSIMIKNNFIDSFCLCLQDGGGIYTYAETDKLTRNIIGNLLLNGIGDHFGVGNTGPNVHGIYIDGGARNVEIVGNSVANCSFSGIQLNSSQNLNIRNNILYNNGAEDGPNFSGGFYIQDDGPSDISNLVIKGNIIVARRPSQLILYLSTKLGNVLNWGYVDSNYYCRPILEPSQIDALGSGRLPYNSGGIISLKASSRRRYYSIDAWRALSGFDLHSKKSPETISNDSDVRFEYNSSSNIKVIKLDDQYLDVKGLPYSKTISIQPYSSIVLFRKDQN